MKPKTEAIRGKTIPWKLSNDEEQAILDWFNAQTVVVDSLRYLVQKEIAENGIRNLQQILPQKRTIESVRKLLHITEAPISSDLEDRIIDKGEALRNLDSVNQPIGSIVGRDNIMLSGRVSDGFELSRETKAVDSIHISVEHVNNSSLTETITDSIPKNIINDELLSVKSSAEDNNSSESVAQTPKKAKKQFSEEEMNSYL
ncbi:hypothetical protein JI735_33830 (plasmid) [Paenibacillus sonchi]|uniref:Uncharacterized protein n=1 Tax=Paenibacillus sonchi TaxID=373687 RepID=A0A974SG30_9BACL|nr:hypothetical protein [Paenibacillus sonchi]QQZ64632.1 hypothetical protein JI735_33830 [Paenibacillus sonchi]